MIWDMKDLYTHEEMKRKCGGMPTAVMLQKIPVRHVPLESDENEQIFLFPLDWTSQQRKFIDVKSSVCARALQCMKDPIYPMQGRDVMNDLAKKQSQQVGQSEFPTKVITIEALAQQVQANESDKKARSEAKKVVRMDQPAFSPDGAVAGQVALAAAMASRSASDDGHQPYDESVDDVDDMPLAGCVGINPFAVQSEDSRSRPSSSAAREVTPTPIKKASRATSSGAASQKGISRSSSFADRSRSPRRRVADMDFPHSYYWV